MANQFERFVMERSNGFFKRRYSRYFMRELKQIEKKCESPIVPLSPEQKKEIKDYYLAHGFSGIRTNWHQYILSATGRWDPRMIPEDFYFDFRIKNSEIIHLI